MNFVTKISKIILTMSLGTFGFNIFLHLLKNFNRHFVPRLVKYESNIDKIMINSLYCNFYAVSFGLIAVGLHHVNKM